MASILGKPGGPGQFPTHDLSTVRGALHCMTNRDQGDTLSGPGRRRDFSLATAAAAF